ncbi:winged helix-turn-helix domain-containing protein [Leucobacter sp. NPDC015123]|uniref:winged helix-turn-helix domain-containing protein n=1 Tax=Leucobacter sp. NPDC015123 TaxID=3364129 RepID=UPI0013C4637F
MELLLLTAGDSPSTSAVRSPGGRIDSTQGEAAGPLPALELLAHKVAIASLQAPLQAALAYENTPHRINAILIDGTGDPRAARAAAVALSGRTRLPRIAVLRDAALAALSPEWDLADFITPEASPAELEARLRLVSAAEATTANSSGASAVEVSGVEIDESNFVATVHGRKLDLTYKEFELLHFLALHPARVFTREQLLSEVWGTDYFGGARTVDVHVRRLRAKLGDHESLISTVRGVGYGFARGRGA